jgi:hypothetical protein
VAVRTAETVPLDGTYAFSAMTDAVRTLSTVPLDSELTIERTVGAYNKSTVYDRRRPAHGCTSTAFRSIVHISYSKH